MLLSNCRLTSLTLGWELIRIMRPKTMFEKIWETHVVHEEPGRPSLIYIDRHLVHEVTSPQAFEGLRLAGRKVRRPDLTFATMDHNVPTTQRFLPIEDPISAQQMETLSKNCQEFGITLFDLNSPLQGIVHNTTRDDIGLWGQSHFDTRSLRNLSLWRWNK